MRVTGLRKAKRNVPLSAVVAIDPDVIRGSGGRVEGQDAGRGQEGRVVVSGNEGKRVDGAPRVDAEHGVEI